MLEFIAETSRLAPHWAVRENGALFGHIYRDYPTGYVFSAASITVAFDSQKLDDISNFLDKMNDGS